MAHNGLDEVRKACGRERSKKQRIQLKDERFLLHRRRCELDVAERARVDVWLRAFPTLRQAYDVKERFTDAYDAPTPREGERTTEKCLRSIPLALDPYFAELTTAVSNWKERICNYFEDPQTNAYTVSVNLIIRELDRVGRGYTFETMRALMLFDETERSKSTSTRHRRPAIPADAYGLIDFACLDEAWDVEGTPPASDGGPDVERLLRRLALDPTVAGDDDEGIDSGP